MKSEVCVGYGRQRSLVSILTKSGIGARYVKGEKAKKERMWTSRTLNGQDVSSTGN